MTHIQLYQQFFVKDVEFLYKNGVDAILMQDFGMINLVREMYPELTIHASTQFNNSSIDTIKLLYQMGVKRVVLSRELTLDEIKKNRYSYRKRSIYSWSTMYKLFR